MKTNDATRATAEAMPADPLIAAIDAYRAGMAAYDGREEFETQEAEQAAIAATYGPAFEVLENWDQPATTRAGAVEALRLAAKGHGIVGLDIQQNMIEAALGFFEQGGIIGADLSEMLAGSENALTAINEHDGVDFNNPVLKTLCERRCQLALAICGHRPLSMAEQRAKAEFLRDWTELTPLTDEEQNALIASLMPKGGEA
jgi:hypothetical protein